MDLFDKIIHLRLKRSRLEKLESYFEIRIVVHLSDDIVLGVADGRIYKGNLDTGHLFVKRKCEWLWVCPINP